MLCCAVLLDGVLVGIHGMTKSNLSKLDLIVACVALSRQLGSLLVCW